MKKMEKKKSWTFENTLLFYKGLNGRIIESWSIFLKKDYTITL